MREDLVEEELCGEPLALEASLHVGEGQDHCVDLTAGDEGTELLGRERRLAVYHWNLSFGEPSAPKVLNRTIAWEGEEPR